MKFYYSMTTAALAAAMIFSGCKKEIAGPIIPEDTGVIAYSNSGDSKMVAFLTDEIERLCDTYMPTETNPEIDELDRKVREFTENTEWDILTVGGELPDIKKIQREEHIDFSDINVAYVAKMKSGYATDEVYSFFDDAITFIAKMSDFDEGDIAKLDELIEIASDEVSDCKVSVLTIKDEEVASVLDNLEPCIGVYGDNLIILTLNKDDFKDIVDLYSGKKDGLDESDELYKDINAESKCDFVGIYGIDKAVKEYSDVLSYEMGDEAVEILSSIDTIKSGMSYDDEAMTATVKIAVKFGDMKTYRQLEPMANGGFGMFKGMLQVQGAQTYPEFMDLFNSLELKCEDGVVELSFVISKKMLKSIDFEELMERDPEAAFEMF